jgi:hypothetical protein
VTKNDGAQVAAWASRLTVGSGECPVIWREDYDNRAEFDAIVEVNHILIGQADAARGDGSTDIFRLVGAMDAVLCVLATGIQIQSARAHRILSQARIRDLAPFLGQPAHLTADFYARST